jgi:tetratricopeptide (TPR) repeat protein
MGSTSVLAIEHIEQSVPAQFKVTRLPDGKSASPVAIASPYEFPVEGRPTSNLMRELRWYLEQFLDYPFHPETAHADHVLDALKRWGTEAFNALFERRDAPNWLASSEVLQVHSDDPSVLSWPWESLCDPQAGYLAHERRMERRLNKVRDPQALGTLPDDRVNILLVVARPYEGDARYRSIARRLVELIQSQGLPAHVDILRPPTFDRLREHLRERPGFYHVLHFDGHGGYGDGAPGFLPDRLQGSQGRLIFEDKNGGPDPKSAPDLSALLREHALPVVVLNACQSGMLDAAAEDPFASVATALLQSGMRSVVAMAYTLYVSGAQVFLPAFYRRLFEAGSVAEAVRAGRQEMLAHKERVCARGRYPLEDWLLPVLYQQDPVDFQFAKAIKGALQPEVSPSRLPEEVTKHREVYGFVGRDGPLLEMERALHRQAPAILIQGLGGVGKTTVARGFLRWLDETGGLDRALWFDFRDIRSAEYVINQTGQSFYGENFGIAKNKLELLAGALGQSRAHMVWDNFESTATNLTGPELDGFRAGLGQLLDAIRGCRGKVIVTSRSPEEWLGAGRRFQLRLSGLDGEERWEYCEEIVRELGLKVDRNAPAFKSLMDQLAGHPFAMRAVLPKLEEMKARDITHALRGNLAALGLTGKDEQEWLNATLRFVEQGLAEDLRPMLALVSLHEGYVDANLLEAIARQVDAGWTRPRVDRLMKALESAGLLRAVGQGVYEMHPLLTSYLRSRPDAAPEACQRAFVDIMGRLADRLTPRELHEQRILFLLHGVNFHFALSLAERLGMDQHFGALTQSLAAHALNSRNFPEASRLYERLARHVLAIGDVGGEAIAYEQLGKIAGEERDFAKARDWYLKSLAIGEQQGNLRVAAITYHNLGAIAQEERDFATAREWYLKSLAISEEQGNLHYAAITYHNLGAIAQEERDFATAREWYLKSLAIKEQQGDLHGAAITYHQLGVIAQEERDFATAQEWYLKSLAIKKKQGNLHEAAIAYHQLGMIAQEERDFGTAREWYLKSLAIKEKQGNLHGAAITYHQLGMIAQAEGGFATAREWYLKSLAIKEQQGDLHGAAVTYHQLGMIAQEERDLAKAREWYLKSLAISEKEGNLHRAATTYHQLGVVAQEERDFGTAREWYLKSLAISDKHGTLHGAASTYGQLGLLAGLEGSYEEAGKWLIRSITSFSQANDQCGAQRNVRNFLRLYGQASPKDKQKLEDLWREAGLGPFPTGTEQ